jgi:putative two-component system response regulator
MNETAQVLPAAPFLRNRLTTGTDGASHRILVVDDNRTITLLLKQMLEAEGHEVLIARDGRQALDLVAEGPPDLIFLDLNLPEVDGYEVCSRLKHNPATRLIPIVIITGQSSFDTKLRAWELGADDFLTKPFHCVEVMARCRSLLRVKRLVDELDSAEAVVFAFARAVEAKSSYTQGHADRVTNYALGLAAQVGLANSDVEVLRQGSVLHDIGKISIPDAVLNKPGPLTEEEYDIVKQHPMQGVRILEPLRSIRETLPLIRWHHERLDGGGYPDGISGDAIPFLVRILSVADIYDALASARPYRTAYSHEECLAMLRSNAAGGGLDAELVEYFCESMASRADIHPANDWTPDGSLLQPAGS